MTLPDGGWPLINEVIDEILDGVDQAQAQGVICSDPPYVFFERKENRDFLVCWRYIQHRRRKKSGG